MAAFQNVRNTQGVGNPYFSQAQNQFQTSASPVTAQDVSQFYNPMAGNVAAQLQNIFGQQQRNTTSQLTQAAGGVGASRIGVGQANLANQQGLAAGQTFSNLYQNALQSALQTKGLQQNAGYGLEGLGTTVQNADLQGANALLGTGGLQQQQQQAQLNSPYNLQLQQFAYPFQTAQYLAGVTGSLSPALGGTQSGQSQTQTTPAQPSLFSQIAGAGLAGIGLAGGFGGLGGKGSSPAYGGGNALSGDAYGGNSANPLPGLSASDYGAGFAGGGAVDPMDAGHGFDDGGPVVPDITEYANSIVPKVQLHPGAYPRPMSMPSGPGPQAGAGASGASGLSGVLGQAGQLMNLGKSAGSLFGGGSGASPFASLFGGSGAGAAGAAGGDAAAAGAGGGEAGMSMAEMLPFLLAARGGAIHKDDGGGLSQEDFDARFPQAGDINSGADVMSNPLAAAAKLRASAMGAAPVPLPRPRPTNPFATIPGGNVPLGNSGAVPPGALGMDDAPPDDGSDAQAQGSGNDLPLRQSDLTAPQSQLPFPNATQGNAGQDFAKSPWAALTSAGLGIMGGSSPWAGINIGKGAQEGLKTLENQRKDTREEVSSNQRAQQLFQQAQQELLKYNRPDANTTERTQLEREKMAQEQWTPTGTTDNEGNPVLFNKKTGQTKVIKPPGGEAGSSPASQSAYDWAKANPDNPKAAALLGDAERYLKTGTMPTNLGSRQQAGQEGQRIRQTAYAMAKERGIEAGDLPKNWQTFKSEQTAITRFMSGPQGNTIRSLNVVTDHADTLRKLGEALKNGDTRVFNTVAQEWARQTGKPAPTNFDMAKQIVGAELIKALGVAGAGTAEERAQLGKSISLASSPAQITEAIDNVMRPLLGGQLRGLRQQFTTSTGLPEDRFNGMLFPGTRQFIEPKEDKKTETKPAATNRPEGVPEGSRHGKKGGVSGWMTPDGKWVPD